MDVQDAARAELAQADNHLVGTAFRRSLESVLLHSAIFLHTTGNRLTKHIHKLPSGQVGVDDQLTLVAVNHIEEAEELIDAELRRLNLVDRSTTLVHAL